jgi:predicted SAM-dependent methyltransferase
VSDGSVLEAIPDNSLDFIIANHLIEHLENPILALKNWNSKLKPQGVLYMAVPDKRFTFDIDRPCTTNQHLHEDFQSSKNELAKRNLDHYRTTAVTIEKRIGQDADERVRDLIARNYSIHFHAWDSDCFRSFIDFVITEIQVPYAILDYNRANRILKECIVILGKQ